MQLNSLEDVEKYISSTDLGELKRDELLELNLLTDELKRRKLQEECRGDFLTFVRTMWSSFIEGAHHRIMCEQFNKIAKGELKRVIINMAPRHSKSEMSSYMLPSWLLGIRPDLKIIQALCHDIIVMKDGIAVEAGSADKILNHPQNPYTKKLLEAAL